MEVFGVGPWELLLVLIIAFVVLGPDRIPEVARTLGRALRQLREYTAQLTKELDTEDIKEVSREIIDMQRELQEMRRDLNQVVRKAINQIPDKPAGDGATRPTQAAGPVPPPSESRPIDLGPRPPEPPSTESDTQPADSQPTRPETGSPE